jgi:hypothetical protein
LSEGRGEESSKDCEGLHVALAVTSLLGLIGRESTWRKSGQPSL